MFLVGEKGECRAARHLPEPRSPRPLRGRPEIHLDFRSVYAGVLEKWLKTPSQPVLGRKFEALNFV